MHFLYLIRSTSRPSKTYVGMTESGHVFAHKHFWK
jgi:hypothetical protein